MENDLMGFIIQQLPGKYLTTYRLETLLLRNEMDKIKSRTRAEMLYRFKQVRRLYV